VAAKKRKGQRKKKRQLTGKKNKVERVQAARTEDRSGGKEKVHWQMSFIGKKPEKSVPNVKSEDR